MDEYNIMERMEEELYTLIEDVGTLEPGSEERSRAVSDMEKVFRAVNERDLKLKQIDADDKKAAMDREHHEQEMKERKINRIIDVGTKVVGTGLKIAGGCCLVTAMLTFEERGVYTSPTVKDARNFLVKTVLTVFNK